MTNILVVEDDLNMGYLISGGLEMHQFKVILCTDGKSGLRTFKQENIHLCVLDIMLPGSDGFTLAKEIRKINEDVPFIFLTSRSLEGDKIKGFQLGCDDYITKPFSIMELILRIQAILKRSSPLELAPVAETYLLGSFNFKYSQRVLVGQDGIERQLSIKEAELLRLFCMRKNELIHRQYIMNKIWGNDDYFTVKSMDVFITRLRKLLKKDPRLEIQNVYGTGFKLLEKVLPGFSENQPRPNV
ncbi:MAG: response regulator transcription factor [Bacteroidia bacterium]|nr:response regulator transcription factor [Bacteroidia bacterium]